MECMAGALISASMPGMSFMPEVGAESWGDMSWDDISMPGMEWVLWFCWPKPRVAARVSVKNAIKTDRRISSPRAWVDCINTGRGEVVAKLIGRLRW